MKKILSLLLLSAASQAFAGCQRENVVFACTMAGGKRVEICKSGRTLAYAFGRDLAKPELKLVKPYGQAYLEPWHGIGPDAYGLEIPNGDTSYHAFVRPLRTPDGMDVEGGIRVVQQHREIVLLCKDNAFINNMEGLDLPERD